MASMFSVTGQTVKVYRWEVKTTVTVPTYDSDGVENGTSEEERDRYFITRADAERFAAFENGTVHELDVSDIDWMDGVILPDVPDKIGEAIKIYNMGREAWEAKQAAPSAEERMAQMEADIAYLAMLTDTDMEV